jgi:hypothetical protein
MTKMLRGMWQSWFGRSQWRDERPSRRLQVPGWLAATALLGAFAGGYLIGGRVGGKAGETEALQVSRPQKAGFIDVDGQPMTRNAFIVSAYPETPEATAKAAAGALSEWLRGRRLQKAKPWLTTDRAGNPLWTVAVFFEGEAEEKATRDLLLGVPEDVPDEIFVHWRKMTQGWPIARRTV